MLNIAGVIVEYNPFHNGHLLHINKTKQITGCDGIIAVMSGSFVQRGLPAVIDKFNRAKMAILNGVDLVIELPVIYSVSSAEFFSYGAVSLLNSTNVVNHLVFGSECNDLQLLKEVSHILFSEPEKYKVCLKEELNKGISFPSARSNAIINFLVASGNSSSRLDEISTLLSSSNNILALEYCKSLIALKSTIKAHSIQRIGASYNEKEANSKYSSATSIRRLMQENKIHMLESLVPKNVYEIVKELENSNYTFPFEQDMFNYIKYKLLNNHSCLEKLPDVKEGLHNRIYTAALKSYNYDDFINNIKTKRYTYTRISRILCQYFLGLEQVNLLQLAKKPCPYIRVLGFNKRGTEILKEIKKNTLLPIFTKLPKESHPDALHLELQSTKLYSLLNSSLCSNADFTKTLVKIL